MNTVHWIGRGAHEAATTGEVKICSGSISHSARLGKGARKHSIAERIVSFLVPEISLNPDEHRADGNGSRFFCHIVNFKLAGLFREFHFIPHLTVVIV